MAKRSRSQHPTRRLDIDAEVVVSQRGQAFLLRDMNGQHCIRQTKSHKSADDCFYSDYYICALHANCLGKSTWSTQVDGDDNVIQQQWINETPHDCAALTDIDIYFLKAESLLIRLFQAEGGSFVDLHAEVISDIRTKFGLVVAGRFKSADELRRQSNRRLRAAVGSPPTALAELQFVPEELCVTFRNDPFLFVFANYEESDGSTATIMVFATEFDLRQLLIRSFDLTLRCCQSQVF